MSFINVDIKNTTEDELLYCISENIKIAKMKRKEIEQLRQAAKEEAALSSNQSQTIEDANREDGKDAKTNPDSEFEDEVGYYYGYFKDLTGDEIEIKMPELLPSRNNPNYKKLMNRLKAEVLKNIKELKDYIAQENLTSMEVKELKGEIIEWSREMAVLNSNMQNKEEQVTEEDVKEEENELIFVPTPYGTIRALEDISHISEERYPLFLTLFQSIKDGTFKNAKRLRLGVCEVKLDQARVVFARLDKTHYAIITAFIKKCTTSAGYKTFMQNVVSNYQQTEPKLLANLSNEAFLEENTKTEAELFRRITKEKVTPNTKEKVVANG